MNLNEMAGLNSTSIWFDENVTTKILLEIGLYLNSLKISTHSKYQIYHSKKQLQPLFFAIVMF